MYSAATHDSNFYRASACMHCMQSVIVFSNSGHLSNAGIVSNQMKIFSNFFESPENGTRLAPGYYGSLIGSHK